MLRNRVGAAILLAPLLLAGCISEEREQEIGDTMAAEVNPHLPLVDDPLLNAYVSSIGSRIGTVTARPDIEYSFYIIDTDALNAFALPGGHIYITRGLLQRTEDGAEFAGVLAHEIGHVAARHGVRKLQRQLRTGSVVDVLYTAILGGQPDLLRDNSTRLAQDVWLASHSRRDEEEADRLAVTYLLRTGVDPAGVVTLLQSLLAEEREQGEPGRAATWFSTHPLTQTRIEAVTSQIIRLEDANPARLEIDLGSFPVFREILREVEPEEPTSRKH